MSNAYLKDVTPAAAPKIIATKHVTVNALNVRSSANANSKIVAHYVKDDIAYIVGIEGNWLKVVFYGNTGYINSKYVK